MNPGYHLTEIPKGKIGEASKILEEAQELMDADAQGVRVMQLVELSDLVGAIDLYMERKFADFSIDDLLQMSRVTRRAFENGHR